MAKRKTERKPDVDKALAVIDRYVAEQAHVDALKAIEAACAKAIQVTHD